MNINPPTIDSMRRKPFACRNKIRKTSTMVITTPQLNGIPKSKLRAIAEPITSAKSHAAMAISQKIQRIKLVVGLK